MNRLLLCLLATLALGAAPALAAETPVGNMVAGTTELEAGGGGLAAQEPAPTPMAEAPQPAAAEGTEGTPVQPVEAAAKPAPAEDKAPAFAREDQPLKLRDYEEPKSAPATPWWQQAVGLALKLVLVLGLIFLSAGAFKKLAGGRVALPGSRGKAMAVIESAQLGAGHAVHLVSVGGERLLVVGTGPQGTTLLAELNEMSQVRRFLDMNGSSAPASPFGQVYDLESAGSDVPAELYARMMGDGRRRSEWPS